MTKTEPPPQQDVSLTDEGKTARWYCVSREGMATLCSCEADAKVEAANQQEYYPRSGPYLALRLVDAAEIDRLKAAADAVLREAQFYGACYGTTSSGRAAIETLAQVLRPNVRANRPASGPQE